MNAMRIGSTLGYLLFGTLAWGFGHRVGFLGCALFSAVALALMFVPAKKIVGHATPVMA